jgi:hypothetical protein
MKNPRFICCVLLATLVFAGGCVFPRHRPDPLAGWKLSWSQDSSKLDKAIVADYQDYIQKLSPKERSHVGPVQFLEDGTGQRAVKILIATGRKDWAHVLIYNHQNERIKVIKYVSGYFLS